MEERDRVEMGGGFGVTEVWFSILSYPIVLWCVVLRCLIMAWRRRGGAVIGMVLFEVDH